MATNKSTLFDPVVVQDLVNKVKGHSSLALLSAAEPIAFNGNKEFEFSMDNEVDIVGEAGAKSEGGIAITPKTIIPLKFEYGARVSDEFMIATEEEKIEILKAFNEGFSKKVARGIDIAAFHGLNPRSGQPSLVVGTNNFDSQVDQTVVYDSTKPDENVEDAIALFDDSDINVTGMAMAPAFRSALAAVKDSRGGKMYPDLAWGRNPGTINGLKVDVNNTVKFGANTTDKAIIGDFESAFKWGFAKEIPLKVIEYGDPDNSGYDLAGHNQVYLRAEVYVGWAILDKLAFARIVGNASGTSGSTSTSTSTSTSGN